MSYDLNYNYFQYLRGFEDEIKSHLKDPNLPYLANQLAMMGVGKKFNDDGSMEWSSDRLDQQFNEMTHHLLKEYKLLDALRGFFEFDCRLDEDNDHKVLAKGADEDIVAFLVDDPDPRYFTHSD
tara:strand:- start:232 stop:603 length:372 start_codon:yes stop_codon:yes gene_type:complete